MDHSDLELGMKVIIVDFGGHDDERPQHWSPDMDEWQGSVVTIADYDSEYVYIEEDEGAWSWHWYDFEPYCTLEHNDPNIVYKRHKSTAFLNEIRAKWEIEKKMKKSST